jgi:predicted DNA-binding transcriptional regulator YafY
MPKNKSALIRYKTIDKCLQNRHKKWTLDMLIDAVSDALYEYEGIKSGVSTRTIQSDIQVMRSNKLGYNAPIIVKDRKYYTYEDREYSITDVPISDTDMQNLSEAVEFLKQFKGFNHFNDLTGIIQKLEDHVQVSKTQMQPIIEYDTNSNLKGLEYLDPIYQAILNKKAMVICYKSFKAHEAAEFYFHGYLLKEYNNRWFVFGCKNEEDTILNLALDRIESLSETKKIKYRINKDFDSVVLFKDIIGVTLIQGMRPENIIIKVNKENAPYILTKPLHTSQRLLEQQSDGITISLDLKINYELERLLLGFGASLEVIKPKRLRKRLGDILRKAVEVYNY